MVLGFLMLIPSVIFLKLAFDGFHENQEGRLFINYFLAIVAVASSLSSIILIGLEAKTTIYSNKTMIWGYSVFWLPLIKRNYELGNSYILSTETALARSRAGHNMELTKVNVYIDELNKNVLLARFLSVNDAENCKLEIEKFLKKS